MQHGKILALSLSFLTACSLAPDYHPLGMPDTLAFKETDDWKHATPADGLPRGNWWEMFGNPELNALEIKLDAANQNLKIAVAQFDEARALAKAARADYFPQLSGNAGLTRARNSQRVANSTPISLYNDYLVGTDLSYEVDLWGRVRNEVASSEAQAAAAGHDLDNIKLSLHAELAIDYFTLRGDDTAQAILDSTVEDYGKALDLTRNRFKGGVTSETDLDQAEAQYNDAKTQAADIRLKRAQLEHAIAVLTGQLPASFTLAQAPLATMPFAVSTGLPSTLLERRPDIAAAERRAAAANAEIGVARAAWFPTFSLDATFGFEAASAAKFLTLPSHFWTLGPAAMGPLFDGGRIAALTDHAHAVYDEAAASYRQTVLNAYQDVEDNLAATRQLAQENDSQTKATNAADRALAQMLDRYQGGIVTYLDVVVTQNTALQAKLSSNDIQVRQIVANIQLVKALGGCWKNVQGF